MIITAFLYLKIFNEIQCVLIQTANQDGDDFKYAILSAHTCIRIDFFEHIYMYFKCDYITTGDFKLNV